MSKTLSSAVVLFSGGQDSTVCLAWALSRFQQVETIGFAYGQRHEIELNARRNVLKALPTLNSTWADRLGPDHILDLPELGRISQTALTRETEITFAHTGLPSTFVPGRNLLFFTYAAAVAYRRNITTLVGGMCETDFSGYPDCRNDTIQSLATTLSLGMDQTYTIATPLMYVDKAETWAMGHKLGGRAFTELIVEHTHTCYLGDRSNRHEWGYGCAKCPACKLRANGYSQWQNAMT